MARDGNIFRGGNEKGWAAEFALIIPALILFGIAFAVFYAFQSASTD